MKPRPAEPPSRLDRLRVVLGCIALQAGFASTAADPASTPTPSERHDMATAKNPASVAAARSHAEKLLPLLAVQLGEWKRVSLEMPKKPRYPGSPTPLEAEYQRETGRASVSASDTGRPSVIVAQWKGGAVERDVDGTHETMYKVTDHVVTERYRAATHEASVVVALANGITIAASSRTADAAALRALIESMDLAAAGTAKR
ncbi:MAG TPA: hypothetical protein VNS61_18015 [Caldimonas sp.]|nr:hypothetical protein [Caldimonas sp.]